MIQMARKFFLFVMVLLLAAAPVLLGEVAEAHAVTEPAPAPSSPPAAIQTDSVVAPSPAPEAARPEKQASPSLPAGRFELQRVWQEKLADDLSWNTEDCGCTPPLSWTIYGFNPMWAKPAVSGFGVLSRIGYYSLSPDPLGNISYPAEWEDKTGRKKQAHAEPERYQAQVDLVISNDKWVTADRIDLKGLALMKSSLLLNLVDNILDVVSGFGFDGATIDFDFSQISEEKEFPEFKQGYLFFIKKLGKTLKQANPAYRLNVVLNPFLTSKDLQEIEGSVDLFLVLPNGEEPFEQLLERVDNIFKKVRYGEDTKYTKKMILFLSSKEGEMSDDLKRVEWNRFGGVGVWRLDQKGEGILKKQVDELVRLQGLDYVAGAVSKVIPSRFCNYICPNRNAIGLGLAAASLLYLGGFISSFFCAEVGSFARKYLIFILVGLLGLVLLFLSLVFCVSAFADGWQTNITVALILLLGGLFAKSMFDKKREAEYP